MADQRLLADIGGNMTRIQIDTRQQVGKHANIDSWFDSHGIEYFYQKLDFGDYAEVDNGGNIVVDSKQNIQEVAGNVGHDHARFVRECDRAAEAGYRLYILVEEHPEYADRDLLATWVSGVCRRCRKCDPLESKCVARRFKPLNGPTLRKIIDRIEYDHGARFLFCDKRDTARVICELLGVKFEA